MRKLYENIEDIYIKGSPNELTSIITAMDISLQNISEGTEQLAAKLVKYSDTNKGTQYERIVARLLALRDVLYQASVDLNGMLNLLIHFLILKILQENDSPSFYLFLYFLSIHNSFSPVAAL